MGKGCSALLQLRLKKTLEEGKKRTSQKIWGMPGTHLLQLSQAAEKARRAVRSQAAWVVRGIARRLQGSRQEAEEEAGHMHACTGCQVGPHVRQYGIAPQPLAEQHAEAGDRRENRPGDRKGIPSNHDGQCALHQHVGHVQGVQPARCALAKDLRVETRKGPVGSSTHGCSKPLSTLQYDTPRIPRRIPVVVGETADAHCLPAWACTCIHENEYA